MPRVNCFACNHTGDAANSAEPVCPACSSYFVEVLEPGVELATNLPASDPASEHARGGTHQFFSGRTANGSSVEVYMTTMPVYDPEGIRSVLASLPGVPLSVQLLDGNNAGGALGRSMFTGFNPGDFASGESMDAIITRLMEAYRPRAQPTSEEVISSLPRLKVQRAGSNTPASTEAHLGSSVTQSESSLKVPSADTAAACHVGEPCSICIQAFNEQEEVVQLPCRHCFHDDCVLPWLKEHNTCPVCRAALPSAASRPTSLSHGPQPSARAARTRPSSRTPPAGHQTTPPADGSSAASVHDQSQLPPAAEHRSRRRRANAVVPVPPTLPGLSGSQDLLALVRRLTRSSSQLLTSGSARTAAVSGSGGAAGSGPAAAAATLSEMMQETLASITALQERVRGRSVAATAAAAVAARDDSSSGTNAHSTPPLPQGTLLQRLPSMAVSAPSSPSSSSATRQAPGRSAAGAGSSSSNSSAAPAFCLGSVLSPRSRLASRHSSAGSAAPGADASSSPATPSVQASSSSHTAALPSSLRACEQPAPAPQAQGAAAGPGSMLPRGQSAPVSSQPSPQRRIASEPGTAFAQPQLPQASPAASSVVPLGTTDLGMAGCASVRPAPDAHQLAGADAAASARVESSMLSAAASSSLAAPAVLASSPRHTPATGSAHDTAHDAAHDTAHDAAHDTAHDANALLSTALEQLMATDRGLDQLLRELASGGASLRAQLDVVMGMLSPPEDESPAASQEHTGQEEAAAGLLHTRASGVPEGLQEEEEEEEDADMPPLVPLSTVARGHGLLAGLGSVLAAGAAAAAVAGAGAEVRDGGAVGPAGVAGDVAYAHVLCEPSRQVRRTSLRQDAAALAHRHTPRSGGPVPGAGSAMGTAAAAADGPGRCVMAAVGVAGAAGVAAVCAGAGGPALPPVPLRMLGWLPRMLSAPLRWLVGLGGLLRRPRRA